MITIYTLHNALQWGSNMIEDVPARVLLEYVTVKHFLFARTLFSHKIARAERCENKVLANNSLQKYYRRIDGKSRN